MAATLTAGEDRRGIALAGAGVQIVRANPNAEPRFQGHGSVFDQRTAIGNPLTWGFYEEVAPGAFSKTLAESDVRMLIDHDPYYVVSRMSAGTLNLAQDGTGLAVDSALDTELSYVGDLVANLRNGNITGMSIGFRVIKDDWWSEDVEAQDSQGRTMTTQVEVRRITEIQLVETSAVTFPAFPQTDAGLRSAQPRAEDPVRAVGLALGRRDGGNALLEARAQYQPGLNDYRTRERIAVTRNADDIIAPATDATVAPTAPEEPAESTPQGAEETPVVETQPADDGVPVPDAPASSPSEGEEPARSTPAACATELRRRITRARRPVGLA